MARFYCKMPCPFFVITTCIFSHFTIYSVLSALFTTVERDFLRDCIYFVINPKSRAPGRQGSGNLQFKLYSPIGATYEILSRLVQKYCRRGNVQSLQQCMMPYRQDDSCIYWLRWPFKDHLTIPPTCGFFLVAFECLNFLFHVTDIEHLQQVVSWSREQPVPILVPLEFHDGGFMCMTSEGKI